MNKNDQEFLVQKIRTQYTEKEHTQLDELKAMDCKVKKPANVFAYIFGAISAIIMGCGMSLVMTDIKDYSNSTISERAVSFYYLEDENAEPEEFLTVYRLTGTNRVYRASLDERFVLFESSDVIYAAKFWDSEWDCGMDEDELLRRFNRIKVDWSAEN